MTDTSQALIRLGLFLGGLGVFLILEIRNPYRPPTESKARRWAVNLGLAGLNAVLIRWFAAGAALFTAQYTVQERMGVLPLLGLPSWANVLATLVFLDAALYVWHLLNHKVPLLWRFHRVHHADRNMDVSTASRFHPGEILISAAVKSGLVFFLGAEPFGILVFESALMLAAQFQHSSLRMPVGLEPWLWPLFVPPSMHRIHHSVRILERDSNYGTVFSLWDRLAGTLVRDVDQEGIVIGVGGHNQDNRTGFHHLLAMPAWPPAP